MCVCVCVSIIVQVIDIFFKMMKMSRFYKYCCPSGDDLNAKRQQRQRLAHVHLEQGFPMCWHFCGSSNVFFSIYGFTTLSKTISFYRLKCTTGYVLFGIIFSMILMTCQNASSGRTQNIEKQ